MREKVGKSRNTLLFFQWFWAPEGRKVGPLKRRVRSQLARWEMKNCTPLWREAHLQVKMYKAHQGRSTLGSWDVEKAHAFVARSRFRSENAQNTSASHHFWKLRCRKSARRCGAKHISKSKCTKHTILGPLLEVQMSKKCTPLWREAYFQVKSVKNWGVRGTFGRSDVASRGRRKGLCTVGHLKRIFKYAFRVARALQKTCSSEMLGGQGADFLRGVAFCSSDLRWFCVTGAARRMAWHQFFVAGAVLYTGGVDKNAKRIGTRVPALHSTFHFGRKSRRIASFWRLSSSKIEDVSQNCFVLDVVMLKH